MSIPYDTFIGAFLAKITEYDLYNLYDAGYDERMNEITDGFLKRTVSNSTFKKVLGDGLASGANDSDRVFDVDIDEGALDEIVDIVSEGMVEQWLKPYLYNQENLQNILNTRDYTMYSPAELLLRIGNAHKQSHSNYINLIREYSYNNGDLTVLHI